MKDLLSDLIEIGAGDVRSMDCVMAIVLKEKISKQTLLERVQLAQKLFPDTNRLQIEEHDSLESFTSLPLTHKQQLVLTLIDQTLALKMSHYLGDAISMLMWLDVIVTGEGEATELRLKSFPEKKDSPYRSLFPVKGWMNHLDVSKNSSYLTEVFQHAAVKTEFTLNDILSLALLRSLPQKHKALWVPVNVREEFWKGFGNGLSRMRLYPAPKLSLKEELTHLRRQKAEAQKSGEIALPPANLKLTPINRSLFSLWLNRPWADWGSLSFSHIEDRSLRFPGIEALYGMTNLHEKHHGGIFAFTQKDKTFITLTFDKNVPRLEAKYLLDKFHSNFQEILHELQA